MLINFDICDFKMKKIQFSFSDESDFEYSVDTTFILKCANGKVKTTAANNGDFFKL